MMDHSLGAWLPNTPDSAAHASQRMRWGVLLLLAVALVSSYPVALWLPASSGWENGWIETAQILALLAGAGMAWRFARAGKRKGWHASIYALGLVAVPMWLLMVGREWSWGATFLAPITMRPEGPFFSSSHLWYYSAVRPLVCLIALAVVFAVVRCRVDRTVWQLIRTGRFPGMEATLVVLAMLASTYADGHLFGWPLAQALRGQEVVLEEWVELVGYLSLVAAQWQTLVNIYSRVGVGDKQSASPFQFRSTNRD